MVTDNPTTRSDKQLENEFKKNCKIAKVQKAEKKKNLFIRVRGFKTIVEKTVYSPKWSAVKKSKC